MNGSPSHKDSCLFEEVFRYIAVPAQANTAEAATAFILDLEEFVNECVKRLNEE